MLRSHRLWFRGIRFCLCVLLGVALASTSVGSYAAEPGDAPDEQYHTVTAIAIAHSAETLLEEGRQAYRAQRFTAAVQAWSEALAVMRSQHDSLGQAFAHSYLTAAHQKLNQWEAADNHITQSLELLPTSITSPQELQVSAQVHNTMGSLHFALGRTQAALETWQHAGELYAQGEDEPRYLNNQLNQVQAQQTLGYYQQARNTLDLLEQRLPQQDVSLQIRGYQKLGYTYRLMGDLVTAQNYLQTALRLLQQQNMNAGPVLLELGNVMQAQGDLMPAIALYQDVIDHADTAATRVKARLNQLKVLSRTDPAAARSKMTTLPADIAGMPQGRSQIYAYIHAAQSLLQLGKPADVESAAGLLAQAIQLSLELQDSRATAYAKGYLGHVYEIAQQWSDAEALTEDALTLAQAINATDIVYQWQWQLGRVLKQQGQQGMALQSYRAAFSTLRSLRQNLVGIQQDLQFSFRDSVEPVYREFVDLLLQPSGAIAARQKSVAMSAQSLIEPSQTNQNQSDQQSRLQEAREVIEALQVAELDNFFRTACLEAQQVALEEVEQTAAAVIYPIILPDRLEIVVSLPGQPMLQYTSAISQGVLEQTLIDWRHNLEKPFTTPEGKILGQQLYGWLIQPLQAALAEADVQTLTFVLDGALRNAPMAALYDGDRYLIEQYAVALAPGLQLLGPRPLQATNVAALLAGLTEPRHGFSALLNVEDELETVANLVDSRLLLDVAFTTDSLIVQVNENRPIIHLATHGQFSSIAAETFILAWDRPIPVNELSALLKTGDLNRTEPIELLILSACETATGDRRAALGLAGVALQSGTRSTLASLWNLDDVSGAVFIQQFYRSLAQPQTTKAVALQQAQLALLQDANYRHPTYWAAYVLVGNWL